jgi:hypothetical protein
MDRGLMHFLTASPYLFDPADTIDTMHTPEPRSPDPSR